MSFYFSGNNREDWRRHERRERALVRAANDERRAVINRAQEARQRARAFRDSLRAERQRMTRKKALAREERAELRRLEQR